MSNKEFLWGEIPSNWEIYELQNLALYISRGKQPKYVEKSGIRALNQKAVRWGYIDESVLKYHNEDVKIDEKHFIRKDDIVINSTGTGTVGRTYHFNYEPENIFADSHITIVRTNEAQLNSRFLMYQLSTKEYQSYIENAYLAGSTGQVEFNKSKVQSLPILLPSLEEQEKIVDILSSLDDKIELNNEMNNTLEEMAQSIFKRWFVDFEFPNEDGEPYKSSGGEMVESELGMIPNGWEVQELGEICEVKGGKRLPKGMSLLDYKTSYPYLRVTDVTNGYVNMNSIKYIDEQTREKISRYIIEYNDLYISIAGTIGLVGSISKKLDKASLTENMARIICDNINKNYMKLYLNSEEIQNIIKLRAVGSTQPKLPLYVIKDIPTLIPEKKLLDKFSSIVNSMYLKIEENLTNNEVLSELRDSLLGKLLSGEIRIK